MLRLLVSRSRTDDLPRIAGPFLFLAAFFIWGLLVYFKHVWLVMEATWLLMLAAAYPFAQLRRHWQLLIALLLLPCFWLNAKWIAERGPAKTLVRFPNEQQLWLSSEDAALVNKLEPVLRSLGAIGNERAPRPTLVMRLPPGIHHYFKLDPGLRHSWFIPAAVRPYDARALAVALDRAAAVVLFLDKPAITPPGTDPRTWDWSPLLAPPFDDAVSDILAAHLQPPVEVDSRCFVFPVR
jgi:hypothetical protein